MAQTKARTATAVSHAIEFAALFVALPIALAVYQVDVPLIPLLWAVTLGCLIVLLIDPTFDREVFFRTGGFRSHARRIVIRFAVLAAGLTILTWILAPEKLFSFVKARPGVWLLVMFAYPVLSVYPQGIIYRGFIFQRYRPLFGSGLAMIAASAVVFALMHIVLLNWIAPALTLIGGLIFADTYRRSQSLLIAWFEQALYGCFLATLGLGHYFYGGAPFGPGFPSMT